MAPSTSATTPVKLEAIIETQGLNSLYTAAATFVTVDSPSPPIEGLVTTAQQYFWWDFVQSDVYKGQTRFGRGGGDTNTPCGF